MNSLADNSIKDLVLAIGKGDKDAFHQLYQEINQKLFAFLQTRLPNREDALDILQDIFVDLWRGLTNFHYKSDKQFYSFVFKIAKRKLAKFYSKQQVAIEFDEKYMTDNYELPDGDIHLLSSLTGKLKPAYQDILHLRYWSQMTFGEIGNYLNINESAAKVRHHRALKKMQFLLEKYEN